MALSASKTPVQENTLKDIKLGLVLVRQFQIVATIAKCRYNIAVRRETPHFFAIVFFSNDVRRIPPLRNSIQPLTAQPSCIHCQRCITPKSQGLPSTTGCEDNCVKSFSTSHALPSTAGCEGTYVKSFISVLNSKHNRCFVITTPVLSLKSCERITFMKRNYM